MNTCPWTGGSNDLGARHVASSVKDALATDAASTGAQRKELARQSRIKMLEDDLGSQ
jgi:hypothetical protein